MNIEATIMEIPFPKPNLVRNRAQKKRKGSSTSKRSSIEDQDFEEPKSASQNACKRQIHSKIEKRRRDKMNTYISQLSTMIPSCNFSHKVDKITVLRMAVQYLKSIRRSPVQCNSEENLKYSFISDVELKKLILQTELVGRSLYDVIHPNDIEKVKGQISCADLNTRHKLTSLKLIKEKMDVDLPNEQLGLHPGDRRSFFFRFKSDVENSDEVAMVNSNCNRDQNQYSVIHCVGYLKCWNPSKNIENPKDCDDLSPLTCLIAIGRPTNNCLQSLENDQPSKFMSKYTVDGKFLYVDHWFTLITGFLPQEVLGTSIYDYIHTEDVNEFAEAHRSMLHLSNRSNRTQNYRFCAKFGDFINVQSEWKTLQNPWKKDVEYFYSKNVVKWINNQTLDEKKQNEKTSDLVPNELLSFSNYVSGESDEQALIDDFNFHHTTNDKNANETTMEAILKLLETDTCISD